MPWRNPVEPLDVDGNDQVSPLDALLVINHLGIDLAGGTLPPTLSNGPAPFVDVVGDNVVTPLDALLIINELGNSAPGQSRSMTAELSVPARIKPYADRPAHSVLAAAAVVIPSALAAEPDLREGSDRAPTWGTNGISHRRIGPAGVDLVAASRSWSSLFSAARPLWESWALTER
jgi:hypothetical protein